MQAMPREPEESRCEIKGCKRVGITGRMKAPHGSILLCKSCAHVWDMATETTRELVEVIE